MLCVPTEGPTRAHARCAGSAPAPSPPRPPVLDHSPSRVSSPVALLGLSAPHRCRRCGSPLVSAQEAELCGGQRDPATPSVGALFRNDVLLPPDVAASAPSGWMLTDRPDPSGYGGRLVAALWILTHVARCRYDQHASPEAAAVEAAIVRTAIAPRAPMGMRAAIRQHRLRLTLITRAFGPMAPRRPGEDGTSGTALDARAMGYLDMDDVESNAFVPYGGGAPADAADVLGISAIEPWVPFRLPS